MKVAGKIYDAAIVGGGPAGVSCAVWLAGLGLSPVVIEAASAPGGLCRGNPFPEKWNASLPGLTGDQVADNLALSLQQASVPTSLNAQVDSLEAYGDHFLLGGAAMPEPIAARFVVLASGVRPRPLPWPADTAEKAENDAGSGSCGPAVFPGVLVGPGRHIVQQDFNGKRVAVLGGGDNAFENALYAIEHGALGVQLYARNLRAQRQFVQSLSASQIHVGTYRVDPLALTVDGQPYDLILVFYGWEPRAEFADQLNLQRSAQGFIATDMQTAQTSCPGVYAVGEVAQRQHPCVVTALADGVTAAKAIQARIEAAA